MTSNILKIQKVIKVEKYMLALDSKSSKRGSWSRKRRRLRAIMMIILEECVVVSAHRLGLEDQDCSQPVQNTRKLKS